jgi:cold shock protein
MNKNPPRKSEMQLGTVKWYRDTLNYGFITPKVRGKDIFIHVSALDASGVDTLRGGEEIEFELGQTREGRVCAKKIRILR